MIFRNPMGYAQMIPPKFSKKKCFIYFAFILALFGGLDVKIANAQSVESPSVILPSPRSREFEKFIDYKVSLFNGLAQTDLFFYNIQLDGLNFPIGISYHGSGIKFGQTTGDVGLGWEMKPDFRISRTVYGRPDEAYTMPNMTNVSGGQAILPYVNNSFATPFARDLYLARYSYVSPGNEAPAIIVNSSNYLDGQFDMFTMAIPEQNGNFIITDRPNKVVTPLNNGALSKISYALANNMISEFTTTDVKANVYKFGTPDANNEGRQINGVRYNTAWMLSEITTPFSNKVTLGYQTLQETVQTLPVFDQTIINGINLGQGSVPYCYEAVAPTGGTVTPSSTNTYDTKILSTIATPNEVVTFNRNANGTVSSIVVAKPGGAQIKKIVFVYDGKFLDQVQISGTDNAIIEKYIFTYTSKNVAFQSYDSYGYGSVAPGVLPNTFGRFYYNGCGGVSQFLELTGEYKRLQSTPSNGILESITFPTGGKRTFAYESNRNNIEGAETVIFGNGLRILSVTDTDPSGGPDIKKSYTYGKGIRRVDPTDPNLSISQKITLVGECFGTIDCGNNISGVSGVKKSNYSSLIDSEIMEGAFQPNNGWYEKVTESFAEGKIEYAFDIPINYNNISQHVTNVTVPDIQFQASYVSIIHPWSTPILKEAATYKQSGTTYSLVQKEVYEYYIPNPSPSDEFIGFKVSPFAVVTPGYRSTSYLSEPSYSIYSKTGVKSAFNYATYTITRGDVLLKKRIVTDYDPSGANIVASSEYDYTSYNLVKSEKKTTSKGEIELTKYKYPFNYTGITQTDNISAGIKKLADINMVTPAIETSRFIQAPNGTNNRLVSSEFLSYKNSIPVPDKSYGLKVAAPITNFSESAVSGGAVTRDARYEERFNNDLYNSKGKIQQRGKPGDTKEVFLWGYNNQYPVARIIGSDFATASGLISQSILDNGGGSTTDAQMRSELNKLRSLANAHVYSYTYSPLVGMTSETDPAGKTTSYEYDHYNRLQTVKNASGLVIESYCYNYAGQVVECAAISPTGSIAGSALQLWGDAPLPVTLIEFNAEKVENQIVLSWSTSVETNSDRFDVERSSDGRKWDRLGVVKSIGESSVRQQYEFIDSLPRKGENLYRLKMIDKDETFTYSRIRSINIDKEGDILLYPNPVTVGQKLNLLASDLANISRISFINSAGIAVLETEPKSEINTSKLAPGLYVVIVTYTDGSKTTHRIVKQ